MGVFRYTYRNENLHEIYNVQLRLTQQLWLLLTFLPIDAEIFYVYIIYIFWVRVPACFSLKMHVVRWKNTQACPFVQNEIAGNGQTRCYWWLHPHAIKRVYVVSQDSWRCRGYSKCRILSWNCSNESSRQTCLLLVEDKNLGVKIIFLSF